jgi:glutaredoxin
MGAKHSEFAKEGFRSSVYEEEDQYKEGALKKKGKGALGTTWRNRYFVLNGHYLKYYDNEKAKSNELVKGTIDLASAKFIEVKDKVVCITLVDGAKQSLQAISEDEAHAWYHAMIKCKDDLSNLSMYPETFKTLGFILAETVDTNSSAATNPVSKHAGPIKGTESIMSKKGHGTSETAVQKDLMYGCDQKIADRICNFNRHNAENSGYFTANTKWADTVDPAKETVYYDSVTGVPLFVAPRGRTFAEFKKESLAHGWPSFRDAEVIHQNMRVLPDGEAVSLTGTHLGHNLPDRSGNRYCINLVSVAGRPAAAAAATDAAVAPTTAAAASSPDARVDALVQGQPVLVFSKTYCPYCKEVKELLTQAGASARWDFNIHVVELDTDTDGKQMQEYLLKKTGQNSVPNVFIGGEHVGGLDTVQAMGIGLLKQSLDAAPQALAHQNKSDSEESVGEKVEGGLQRATFGAGCFWGVELFFQRMHGVEKTRVGYIGGQVKNPTYRQVCNGTTGHAEAVEITFDPSVISYDALLAKLWARHDPTTLNRQGNDKGTQYRSAIFYYGAEQKAQAAASMAAEQTRLKKKVTTQLGDGDEHFFYAAETYHQQYLEKGGQEATKGSTAKIACYG